MKTKKNESQYLWIGIAVLVVGCLAYGAYNYTKTGSFLPSKSATEVENTTANNTTLANEVVSPKTTPTPTSVNCGTNGWDCFAQTAKDGNKATLVSFMKNFPYFFTGMALDLTTEFKITNVASNGDVTLSERKTKVVVKAIDYTPEQLEALKKAWGITGEITPEQIESSRQEVDAEWQPQMGLTKISVYTRESFLVFVEQWKRQDWSWNSDNGLGQPYKVIRDDDTNGL